MLLYYVAVTLLSYDEGYYTDDKTLAGALWKCLFDRREDVEPKELLHIVDYVHRNMSHLESITNQQLIDGFISFLPLDSDKPDVSKDEQVQQILRLMS